jgi:transposase
MRCWPSTVSGSSVMRTSPSVTRPALGRPSIPPSLLAKVLLLAYRDGLSDQRAMEALRFDLRWKVALDLPVDHPGFHPTSLVKFRARLLLHGKERVVFERSIALATEVGLLEGDVEQIVDSTPMLGAAASSGHRAVGPRETVR